MGPPIETDTRGVAAATVSMSAVIFLLAMSFGALAHDEGFSVSQATTFSFAVLGGAGQFAFLAIFADGGPLVAAVFGALLINARFLPLAMVSAPWLPRGLSGVFEMHLVIEPTVGLALGREGRAQRRAFLISGVTSLFAWTSGTALGATGADWLPDSTTLGLDAALPCLIVGLMPPLMRRRGGPHVVLISAAIAAVSVLVLPATTAFLGAGLLGVVIYWCGIRNKSDRSVDA